MRSRSFELSFLLIIFLYSWAGAGVRTTVVFKAEDGLGVVADKYFTSDSLPWVLMFHQAGSSRGEFRDIAPKITKLGYNCLAVDLRHGREINFIPNETAIAAQSGNYSSEMQDAITDMNAAADWVAERSNKQVILFGSSFSASLAMISAVNNSRVKAVISFSPGEFFGHPEIVQNAVAGLEIPLFIASTRREYPYVTELSSGISNRYKTIFSPAETSGTHGAKALWESSEHNQEYWLALLLFFNRIN